MDNDFIKSVTGSGVGHRPGDADAHRPIAVAPYRSNTQDPACTTRTVIDIGPIIPPGKSAP
jgi:hypothetical protein